MFPEHVERSFLDPEYSFDEYFQLGSQSWPNWEPTSFAEYFQLGLRRNICPIKNGLKTQWSRQIMTAIILCFD